MKPREISLNAPTNGQVINGQKHNGKGEGLNGQASTNQASYLRNGHSSTDYEVLDDEPLSTRLDTPMHPEAHHLPESEKIEQIADKFADIMHILGLDLTDDSLKGTPQRVAKMYVQEVFQGLNPENKPAAKLFDNKYRYGQMLVEKDITLHSYCEHHFVPITGVCHVGYVSSGKVIGLSKINRIVRFYAKRPQVQERLTEQIAAELKEVLQTEHVAVVIDADHMCVSTRGVEDCASSTLTSHYSGQFDSPQGRQEFWNYLKSER
jgi:GTP cyclohydrolase I